MAHACTESHCCLLVRCQKRSIGGVVLCSHRMSKKTTSPFYHACASSLQIVGLQECDILSCIWSKLLASACVNPANVLAHGFLDTLLAHPRTARLIEALATEVMAVGQAVGAKFAQTAAAWRAECAAKWPRCKVSTLQDVEAGRELEVAALVEVVVDMARQLGIAVPRLDTVCALIHHRNENLVAATNKTCH